MAIALLGGAALLLVGLVLAVFPPRHGPHWWRHHTRPLRRLVRPRHYRW